MGEKNNGWNHPEGQVFVEGILWICLLVFLCLVLNFGLKREYRVYKRSLEQRSGMPRSGMPAESHAPNTKRRSQP